MPDEEHFRKLERMYVRAPGNDFYAPRLTISHAATELVIPIDRRFYHSGGAAHGSVYFKALDDAAFFAVNSLVEDVFVLTVTFTTYLTGPISEGAMHARGRVVHAAKSFFVAESVVCDTAGREIGRGSGTFTAQPHGARARDRLLLRSCWATAQAQRAGTARARNRPETAAGL